MKDIQKTKPEHEIDIQRVGISGLKLPIFVADKQKGVQHSVADIDIFVDLPGSAKGTHMSRLAAGVQKFWDKQFNLTLIGDICKYIKQKSEADTVQIIYRFPYFISKLAPVSKEPGLIHCDVEFDVVLDEDGCFNNKISVTSYVTSLCPCSKEISESGAHNQRSKIKISGEPNGFVWIEDLVNISENCSSCPIYSVLKRVDEKFVTEHAYANPLFVEDIARKVYYTLEIENILFPFSVEVWNMESIHTHDAYAKLSKI